MKIVSDGLRFQKGQTSFNFNWQQIKKLKNDGKLWAIDFSDGSTDSFELGISMDILIGNINNYGNEGSFQAYTRNIR
ncbi:MAG: hypothetical protein AB1403_04305, partial [Candidatus Riflebacteria bacterium]